MARDARGVRAADPRPRREGRHFWHNRVIAGRRPIRLAALALAAAVFAAGVASSASAALFFLFKPTSAKPGEVVAVRTAPYTPPNFTSDRREKPFQRPIRLYLVPNAVAGKVRTRFDRRLHFIGSLAPDRYVRGALAFTVPLLDTDEYAVAAWWPGDARYGRRTTFFVWPVGQGTASRYRPLMLLRVKMPSATETCPVTVPKLGPSRWGNYGNGLLSTGLPRDGVLVARTDPDGTLFEKLFWLPHGFTGVLTVRGDRLDAPSPSMRVLAVNWGYASTGPAARGSWASAVTFPSEGCWRISGRVGDVSLSYVVKVVRG